MHRGPFHLLSLLAGLLAWLNLAAATQAQVGSGEGPWGGAARVSAEVEVGWGGLLRVGRWNPAVVRARADRVAQVEFEWYVPRPGRQAMVLRQLVPLNPEPGDFFAYLPIGPDPQAIHLRISDAATGRTLARWPEQGSRAVDALANQQVDERVFVGLAGEDAQLPGLDPDRFAVGPLPLDRLPDESIGFDALDVLVLGRPVLAGPRAPTPRQQAAVVSWVRSGGRLVIWLGPGDFHPDAPLVALLPPGVGDAETVQDGGAPGRAGWYLPVPDGFGRVLATHADRPAARSYPVGLGQVTLLQVSPALLPPDLIAGALDVGFVDRGAGSELLPMAREFVERGDRRGPWGGWRILWVIGLVAGPLDTLVLWVAGRRMRRAVPAAGWVLLAVASAGWFLSADRAVTRDATAVITQDAQRPLALDVYATASGHDAVALLLAQRPAAWYALLDGGATAAVLALPPGQRFATPREGGPLRDVPFRHAPGGTAWAGAHPVFVAGAATLGEADVLPRLQVNLRPGPDGRPVGTLANVGLRPLRDVTVRLDGGQIEVAAELAAGDVIALPDRVEIEPLERTVVLAIETPATRAANAAAASGGFVVTARDTLPAATLGLPGGGEVTVWLRAVVHP